MFDIYCKKLPVAEINGGCFRFFVQFCSVFSEINPVLLYFFSIKIIPMEMPSDSES